MAVRYFALIYGIVFLVVGIAGFVPGLLSPLDPGDPEVTINGSTGRLFGLFLSTRCTTSCTSRSVSGDSSRIAGTPRP